MIEKQLLLGDLILLSRGEREGEGERDTSPVFFVGCRIIRRLALTPPTNTHTHTHTHTHIHTHFSGLKAITLSRLDGAVAMALINKRHIK